MEFGHPGKLITRVSEKLRGINVVDIALCERINQPTTTLLRTILNNIIRQHQGTYRDPYNEMRFTTAS